MVVFRKSFPCFHVSVKDQPTHTPVQSELSGTGFGNCFLCCLKGLLPCLICDVGSHLVSEGDRAHEYGLRKTYDIIMRGST